MAFEVRLTENARSDYRALHAWWRSAVKRALEVHLRHEPRKVSRRRIKRLRGVHQPQYRLRVDESRVFYDVGKGIVDVLAIVPKSQAARWLEQHGVIHDDPGSAA